MMTLEREERYIVVKRNRLTEELEGILRRLLADHKIDTVECVVVESDWPEYEPVWSMLERDLAMWQHAAQYDV
jgi:hypothetical protein